MMCGIAGGLWLDEHVALSKLSNALRRIHHRGPDDTGSILHHVNEKVFGLGHTRLSIIDLSPGGHQPMRSKDGRYVIVYNGEIFNYRELRSELQATGNVFETESDTEVLLALWNRSGIHGLRRLVGMFAFVILDTHTHKLTCVRDAFGIKPLYFFYKSNGFYFASEIQSLLELLPIKPELNWQRAYDYLVHDDYDSTPDTFYSDVHQLPPGHWLSVNLVNNQTTEPSRWWAPNVHERPCWSFNEAVEILREQFLKNIRLHLRSDVPLGAALSGGVDSTAIVCAMRHVEPGLPIHTFSFIASDSKLSEEHWVDRANKHVDAIAHKVIVHPNEFASDVDNLIETQGEPFGSTSIYAQYRVYKLASERGVKVTLDGQGADEMLAGYSGYAGQRLRSIVETWNWKDAYSFMNQWASSPGRSRIGAIKRFTAEISDGWIYDVMRLCNGDSRAPDWINSGALRERGVRCAFPRYRPPITARGRRVIGELAQSLSVRGLASLLRHGDRNSMRFSIESRVPFLTLDMVELLLSMPENYLISNEGQTKCVFRKAMEGIAPAEIMNRVDKIGFATPEKEWLLPIAKTVREWLQEDQKLPFLKQDRMLEEFDRIVAGQRKYTWQAWRWINFCRWHSRFF